MALKALGDRFDYGDYEALYNTYIFRWGNNPMRAKYKGKRCKKLASGRIGSVLIEFEDGHKMVTSRRAIQRCR